jgi:hypothetical protein
MEDESGSGHSKTIWESHREFHCSSLPFSWAHPYAIDSWQALLKIIKALNFPKVELSVSLSIFLDKEMKKSSKLHE